MQVNPRHNLTLKSKTLRALHSMCEDSLNVPAAKVAQKYGRNASLAALDGHRTLIDFLPVGSAINERVINFKPPRKYKQLNRKCGWPATPEARAIVKARTKELKKQRLDQPRVADDGPFLPRSFIEKKALYELKDSVAAALGIEPDSLAAPRTVVSMIQASKPHCFRTSSGRMVYVSVKNGTIPVLVYGDDPEITPPSLESGDAMFLDSGTFARHPDGDWRVLYTFQVLN